MFVDCSLILGENPSLGAIVLSPDLILICIPPISLCICFFPEKSGYAEPINKVNRLKFFFKTRCLIILIFGMDHQELNVYIFYINGDHGLPLP